MKALVLDAEAVSVLARARSGTAHDTVRAFLSVASERGIDVLVPAAVLAEQYRGGAHDQQVDACLGRQMGIEVADTDRHLARWIGNLLARAGLGSEHHVDASNVAVAADQGGGVILTGDADDLETIAASAPGVTVEPI